MITRRVALQGAICCAALSHSQSCSSTPPKAGTRAFEEFEQVGDVSSVAALRRAFDWVESQGRGTITLPPQRILLLDEEVQLPSGLTLTGNQSCVVRQTKPGLRAFVGDDVRDLVMDGFSVRGADIGSLFLPERRQDKDGESPRTVTDAGLVQIRSTRQGASNNLVFRRLDLGTGFNLLSIRGARGVLVENCRFSDWLLCGGLAPGSTQVKVSGNLFQRCAQQHGFTAYAFTATGDAARGFPQRDLQFIGNIVRDIPSWDGFMTHEVDGLLVMDNQFMNVRNGIDISSPSGTIANVSVRRNKIVHADTDPWAGRSAAHFSIAVAADPSAPIIDTVIVEDNVCISANTAPRISSGGYAIGALIFSRIQNLTVARNQILKIGNQDSTLKSPKGYSAISIFDPRSHIVISDNEGDGELNRHFIEIHHADGISGDISITDNYFRSLSGMRSLVRFVNGDFRRVVLRNNRISSGAAGARDIEVESSNTHVEFVR